MEYGSIWALTLSNPEGRRQLAGDPGAPSFSDPTVSENATYDDVVRSVDLSFNRSGYSNEVTATAELRTVTATFNVSVSASTPADGRVYIAGTLDRLDGGLPSWDPGGVALTQVDATHWTLTLSGKETTQIEYKYTLGGWEFVEKGAACDEIANRQLTLSYGAGGSMTVNDTVLNWRNLGGCPNYNLTLPILSGDNGACA